MGARIPVLRARYLMVRRWPFTRLSLAGLGLGAILTGGHDAELSAEWLSRQGFAPQELWLLRWERLATPALVTAGGVAFWGRRR